MNVPSMGVDATEEGRGFQSALYMTIRVKFREVSEKGGMRGDFTAAKAARLRLVA